MIIGVDILLRVQVKTINFYNLERNLQREMLNKLIIDSDQLAWNIGNSLHMDEIMSLGSNDITTTKKMQNLF